jgi:ABC-2 type transport system permease protein
VAIVAEREFLATVTRVGYVATLVLMPVLMLAIAVLPAIGVALSGGPGKLLGLPDPDEEAHVAIVEATHLIDDRWIEWHNRDQTAAASEGRMQPKGDFGKLAELPIPQALLGEALRARRDQGGFDEKSRITLRRLPDRPAVEAAVADGSLAAAFVFGDDYLETGRVAVLLPSRKRMISGVYPGHLAVARLIRHSVASRHISDPALVARMVRVMEPEDERIAAADGSGAGTQTADGLEDALSMLLPLLFASFFTMSIFVSSGYLLDGVGEEKENRILEVLLASVTPEELLLGKMVGLGAAGLLQAVFFAGLSLAPMIALGLFSIGLWSVLGMTVCALLGYAQYASLMGASGAVAGNRHEGRQISAVWSLLAASPLFVLPVFMTNASGPIAVTLSLFPLTAPVAMTLRLGIEPVPLWQVAIGFLSMGVTAWVSWRVGSRVFRVALLMTGARPPIGRIWEWVRKG